MPTELIENSLQRAMSDMMKKKIRALFYDVGRVYSTSFVNVYLKNYWVSG